MRSEREEVEESRATSRCVFPFVTGDCRAYRPYARLQYRDVWAVQSRVRVVLAGGVASTLVETPPVASSVTPRTSTREPRERWA